MCACVCVCVCGGGEGGAVGVGVHMYVILIRFCFHNLFSLPSFFPFCSSFPCPLSPPLPPFPPSLLLQASGEAQYTTDIPTQPAELAAAFVLTTQVQNNLLPLSPTLQFINSLHLLPRAMPRFWELIPHRLR